MRHKENKKKQALLSIFIAIIMVSSILGYMLGRDEPDSVNYGKYKFYPKNFLWATKIQSKEYEFNNLPTSVENINISKGIFVRIKGTLEVDSTYDENSSFSQEMALTQHELSLLLKSYTNIYLRNGLTKKNSYNLPVITCEDATDLIPVLYFKIANETQIYQDGNCIMVEARNGAEFLRIKDRIAFGILGIIE